MTGTSPARPAPGEFLWGTATAAYQVEGAARDGGRGPSIWDTFSHTPGRVANGDTGDVAADHYHRWRDDVGLLRDLGVNAYRFSISWPRVQPGGRGQFNPEGIAFYSRLVDGLLEAGIEPLVTLYHWDLPQEREDDGGWPHRDTASWFADYAARMAQELGDRVTLWSTVNEPWCTAFLGYASGVHAPGRAEPAAALAAVHHLNLAHGLAATAIRDTVGSRAQLSAALNVQVVHPDDPGSEDDQRAVRRIEALANETFLGPMLDGEYPSDLLADTAAVTDWSFVRDGDLRQIQVPLDVLGVNYYCTVRVRAYRGEGEPVRADGHGGGQGSPWVAADDVEFLPQPGPHTAMGWNIAPDALRDLLLGLHRRYPDLPLMVTENGAAFHDVVTDGRVHDSRRVQYLHDHVAAVQQAQAAGADVRGYFVWSLMDNFEWSYGYDRRFGVVRIEEGTLERIWKDSAYWYRSLARSGELPPAEADPSQWASS